MAALGVGQMERLEELLAKRAQVARWYYEQLKDVEGVQIPYISPNTTLMSWFVYAIRLTPDVDRDAVIGLLAERGIPSRPYFTPIHLQPFYVEQFGYSLGDFPVTEHVASASLAIPFHGNLDQHMIEHVVDNLRECIADSHKGTGLR